VFVTPKRIASLVVAVLTVAASAYAVTAGDVMNKMTKDERGGYIGGALEMAMFLASSVEKNNAKSECILNWYYRGNGQAQREILATFDAYKDKPAAPLLNVLINRHCGPNAAGSR
jgi:hypothetical protein